MGENKDRPWWAFIDTALLLAILALFGKMSAWQGEIDEWRQATQQQIVRLSSQNITPGASQQIAVLSARIDASERSQAELKVDIVARLDRQDKKLDAIAERIDKLRNGH